MHEKLRDPALSESRPAPPDLTPAVALAEASAGGNTVPDVRIRFTCASCGSHKSITVPWSLHHILPVGWACRDLAPTGALLPRRTNHAFACGAACQKALDIQFPTPPKLVWFDSP